MIELGCDPTLICLTLILYHEAWLTWHPSDDWKSVITMSLHLQVETRINKGTTILGQNQTSQGSVSKGNCGTFDKK